MPRLAAMIANARNEEPVPMKANRRKAAASALAPGSATREGEHHAGIDDEVEDDVEKAAEVGEPRLAGHGAVQAVGETVQARSSARARP